MNIKTEPVDEIAPSNTPESTQNDDYQDSVMENFGNGGRSTQHSFDGIVKKAQSIDNEEQDSKQNVLKMQLEGDNVRWENYKDDVLMKIEKLDVDECSNANKPTDQYISIEFEQSSYFPKQERYIKKETVKEDQVPIVLLEKFAFYDRNFVCNICLNTFSSFRMLKVHKICHNECILNIEYERSTQEIPETTKNTQGHHLKFDLSTESSLRLKEKLDTFDIRDGKLKGGINIEYERSTQSIPETTKITEGHHLKFDLSTESSLRLKEKFHKSDISDGKVKVGINIEYERSSQEVSKTTDQAAKNSERIHLSTEKELGISGDKLLSKSDLRNHKISDKKPFKCDQCSYSSALSYSLKTHIMTHTGEKPYKCDVCDYKSAKSSDVKTHKMTHSGQKPFKCDQCNYKTAYSFHLKTHKMSHTGEKPLKCDKCDFTSAHSSHLKTHKMLHSGEKPFKCDVCSFKSVRSTDLKRHKMLHSGEKPYHCNVCSYKTAHYTHLKTHKVLHTDVNVFDCNRCDFKALRSTDLKRHMVVHTGKESFKCGQCNYVSTQLVYLKRHQISHSGVKSFGCDICDFKTAYACNLKTHKLSHTNVKPFMCGQCDFECGSSYFLKRHGKSHTKTKTDTESFDQNNV